MQARIKSVIVGTAGHIDHGKTALVKALTGVDTDRLEEEKRRGITIDLGFAHLELPDRNGHSLRFGFVDVPGHERFVRNMLAGIGGIDLVLLVIAADEGIKPQTREHFEICRLLGIRHGITVLTKADKVSAEKLRAMRTVAGQFLQGSFFDGSPIVAVSSATGEGIAELKRELGQVAEKTSPRDASSNLRLPIDRVFSMRGFGTVVTGALVSGAVRTDEELEALPSSRRVRVRGVQVYNAPVGQAHAGERTALNLAGIQKSDLSRGMTLASPGTYQAGSIVDVRLSMIGAAKPPKIGTRFHLYSFTAETVAAVQRFDAPNGYARLRFAGPQLLLPGDRFILRQFSPVFTVGGGMILDAAPAKEFDSQFLNIMQHGEAAAQLCARIARQRERGLSIASAVAETGWTRDRVLAIALELAAARQIKRVSELLVEGQHFQAVSGRLLDALQGFHRSKPLVAGTSREELRGSLRLSPQIFAAAVAHLLEEKKIEEANDHIRLAGHAINLNSDEADARTTIETAFSSAGLKVPALKDVLAALPIDRARAHQIVTLLLRERVLIKLGDDLVFHSAALNALRQVIREYKATSASIDVARFKDMTNVSRKYAIPLLEFLDRERVTRRQGDVRIIL